MEIDETANAALFARAAIGSVILLDVIPGYQPTKDEMAFWRKAAFRAVLGIQAGSPLASAADLVLPVACFQETSGTYVNAQGKAQWIRQAVPPPGEAKEAWSILASLAGIRATSVREIHAMLPEGIREAAPAPAARASAG